MKKTTSILYLIILSVFACISIYARTVRACFYESPGCHELGADGKRSGYGYDFMEKLAAKAGWQVEYLGYDWPWDKVLTMLEKGELDIVDFTTYKPDRAKKMLFSKRPMAYSGCAIRTTSDRAARFSMSKVDTWGHIRVGVMKGDVTEKEFYDFADDFRLDYEVHAFDTETEGVEAMRRGELDLVAFEELVSFPELVLVEICKPFADHLVTRKDNPALMAEIDAAMAKLDHDEPGWMTDLHQKYFPSPTVYAYVPAKNETSESLFGYLSALLPRLNEVLARNIVIRECRADFSDADFSQPSFACGVTFTSKNAKRFLFPLQSAGCRRVDLLALPEKAIVMQEKLKDKKAVRIGYLQREEADFSRLFKQYMVDNAIAFETIQLGNNEDILQCLREGRIDLVLCHSGDEKGLALVESCGFIDFYLVPSTRHPELAAVIDKALKYLRLDESHYIYDLEDKFFGIDPVQDRRVNFGIFSESGLSVRRDDGSYDGLIVDLMTEIARRAGWHLRNIPLSFAEAQRALAEGAIDVMGGVAWTPERDQEYNFSKFDMGPLCYALMKCRDGRMLENRPDTWNGAKIGFLRGSTSKTDLEAFLTARGIQWEGVPVNDIKEGEKLVREGKLDAMHTLAHEDNRDLVPLAMLPTKLCYFCSNKRKPWIKKEMDTETEELLRQNPRWISDIYEQHLANSRGMLFLTSDEIDYVDQCRGHRIRISFLDEINPIIFRDTKTGEIKGLARQLFERISERTGLEFDYLTGDCPADILLRIDGTGDERLSDVCVPDWFKLQVCRVRRREPIPSAKGIAAIMKSRDNEVEIALKNGVKPIVLKTREDCYHAVQEGRVEYMVDLLPVAMKWLDVEKRYSDLYYQRVDPVELSRPVTLYSPTLADPRLRSILAKARDSLPPGEADAVLFETLYGGGRPLSMKVKSALLTAFVVVLLGAGLLFLTHQHLRVARSANRAKTNFLFNMSHDIRTPMNAIRGFTGIARKNINDQARVSDCLDKIDSSGELLLSLINGVLDMSRVESGKAKLEEERGDVMLSFASVEPTLHELAKARDITLSFDFGKIVDRYIYIDFEKSNRIFVNLISNAIKYSKPNGWVRVRCEQISAKKNGRGLYRYTFSDNGIGMSEDFQKHLFEEFARERNSTTSGIQGTGLGLALCKSFIDLMGGTITCKSKLGEGTTFTLELPFRIQEDTDKFIDEKTEYIIDIDGSKLNPAASLNGRRILLVEDNEMNREIAEEILEEKGVVVDTAENGQAAVNMVKEHGASYYDCILMDIQMPIMNGYEATKAIRAMYPDTKLPIIALSANAFAEDKKKSLEAGMDDHVAKPINVKELVGVLSKFL